LRSIAETTNGTEALTLLIMKVVSSCLHHDAWSNRGLALLEAMDLSAKSHFTERFFSRRIGDGSPDSLAAARHL
jgi:hypothetical protein